MIKIFRKHIFMTLIIIAVIIYISTTFLRQESSLRAYKQQEQEYQAKITEQENYKESLLKTKDNVNDPQYIEQIARDKLGMYLPNERVYVDIGN